jgi:hypothetical protein
MEDCGRDLEGAPLTGFKQGRSLLLQVGGGGGRQIQQCASEAASLDTCPPARPPAQRCPHPLWQVALTLAVAEEACEFEHRDLHWGNVLLKAADSTTTSCTYRGMQVRACSRACSSSRAGSA